MMEIIHAPFTPADLTGIDLKKIYEDKAIFTLVHGRPALRG
jgi:hypothetical protein